MKLSSIFLIFTISIATSKGQIIFDETVNSTYTYKKGQNPITDSLLTKHARLTGEPGELSFQYNITVRAVARAQSKTQLMVFFQLNDSTGNYRGMPLSAALLPQRISFVLQRLNEQGSPIESYRIIDQILMPDAILTDQLIDGSYSKDNLFLRIIDRQFKFDPTILAEYDDRTALIDDYYYAHEDILNMHKALDKIDLENFENFDASAATIVEVNDFISHLKGLQLTERLGLSKNDPLGLVHKMGSLDTRADDSFRILKAKQTDLDIKLYNKAVSHWNKKEIDSARYYFQSAVKVNPYFTPGQHMVARILFIDGKPGESKDLIKNILKDMQPDPETVEKSYELIGMIYQHSVQEGMAAYRMKNYDLAKTNLEQAMEICGNMPHLTCSGEVFKTMLNIPQEMYQASIEACRNSIRTDDFATSVSHIEEIWKLSGSTQTIARDTKAESELRRQIGEMALRHISRDLSKSVSEKTGEGFYGYFLLAERQILTFGIEYPSNLFATAAQNFILQLWNNLDRNDPAAIEDLMFIHTEVGTRLGINTGLPFDSLSMAIKSICPVDGPALFSNLSQSQDALSKLEYHRAMPYLLKASELLAKNNCGVPFGKIRQAITQYSGAEMYQVLLQNARKSLSERQYAEFLIGYQKAENHYNFLKLQSFGLLHTPLTDVVNQSDDLQLRFEAAHFFAARENIAVALGLIKYCMEVKYETKRLNELQNIIGEAVAEKYFSLYGTVDPELISGYFFGQERQFRNARASFQKRWRTLRI